MNTDGLQVDLVNGQITVTRPATNDTITYRKSEDALVAELLFAELAPFISTAVRYVRALRPWPTSPARRLRPSKRLGRPKPERRSNGLGST
jgi:hypothetical protein